MKHVWDIDYCPKKEIAQMSVFELREYTKRLEEELTNKDKTIMAIIDGNRRKHGEWVQTYYSIDGVGASRFKCSKCENEIRTYGKPYNFCPKCGADMRGKNDE